jgi:probable phosphoglycerate mutase
MILYIIRHDEPSDETDSLTELGKKQANALAERLAVQGFDEIYSSPLGRAIQTAQPTCEKLGLPHKVEEWMSEDLTYSDLSADFENGRRDWSFACPRTKLLEHHGEWFDNPVFATCRTAQKGYARIANSSDEFLARLGYEGEGKVYKIVAPNNKRIAAFCHHGLGTSWLSHLPGIPPNVFWSSFNIAHSSVSILDFGDEISGYSASQCIALSDVSHIYKAGLDVNLPVFK